jgi:transcriptional repressor NrdR
VFTLNCPYCHSPDLRVVETRETNSEITRRRRECIHCKKRFTTYERIESTPLIVIKKDQTREHFDKEKIVKGMLKACEKRPITLDQVKNIAEDIESNLLSKGKPEITSASIGELVMKKLKKLDKVAYIRFASVYREFEDTSSFIEEIKLIGKNKKTKKG